MYLVNLYMHAWFFHTRAWGTLSLFLFPRAGFSLPFSWILKPKYDWERKRSVRNQRGGLSAKTRRGDMGVRAGEENFLAFLSRFLECPELFAICNIHHRYVKRAKPKRISALSNWGKNLQNNRLNARCARESFCYPRQQGPSLFKGSQKTFPLHCVKELLNRPWRFL